MKDASPGSALFGFDRYGVRLALEQVCDFGGIRIKFGDEENQAFRDALLKANQAVLSNADPSQESEVFPDEHASAHANLERKLASGGYDLDVGPVLAASVAGTRLTSEMVLEAGLIFQLSTGDQETLAHLGSWDYLSHQVVASPFKPVDYMDKMDVFGYRFIPRHRPTISQYLVAELKKDAASITDVQQIMKYVDWVKDEYAHGDYSMIRAFLVAYDFAEDATDAIDELSERHYTIERRPPRTEHWDSLTLLKYRYSAADGKVRLEPLAPTTERLIRL